MRDNKYLTSGQESYLTKEATEVLNLLVKSGLDPDLAFEIVATDETSFDLPTTLSDKKDHLKYELKRNIEQQVQPDCIRES